MLNQLRAYCSFLQSDNSVYKYMPFGPASATRSRTRLKITTATCIVFTLAILTFFSHPVERAKQYGILKSSESSAHDAIPNIVHYVQIKKDANSVLRFPFSSFLTICAAVLYIKPTEIYIHTDFNQSEIKTASMNGDRWTRAVVNTFSDIINWNQVHVPNFAGQNADQPISAIQHRSDFIRWEAIAKIGGIYMDWDVVPLRPLTPLLNAGFAFVGGRHYGGAGETSGINGTINNGVFMTKPNSTMARIVVREQHAGFNGAWGSNLQSMTKIAELLVPASNEVLILDRTAFAPTHWFLDSTDPLFIPNDGKPSPVPDVINSTDPMELYENAVNNRRRRAEWEMDFSSTYMLHAFALGNYQQYVNPKIIMSRTSNFGIATYDVVKHMVDLGYINGDEEQ
ncbi:Gly-transf-sug domain containing protein [Curvularia clavata]|uniref:Gly-transf-sug domain containing protein n=1 Tax=Curvularia clavata TaxID=95742 RepID=A0A9Q8ZAJ4_CURCL|nr:Gly-transf-sug domain containing protein [Curvularia clavata]